MERLVCLSCYSIFKKHLLQKNKDGYYMCPLNLGLCHDELVEIDEGLADVIVKLNKHKVTTLNCCFGHLPKVYSTGPYITFGKSDKEKLLKLQNFIYNQCKKYNYNIEIEEIKFHEEIKSAYITYENIHSLTIRTKDWSIDILERISQQASFLLLLYSILSEASENGF
ncbi:MAG: hypothetical protein ACFFG0_00150 [Candidatus Thorarchaeota archaeon]